MDRDEQVLRVSLLAWWGGVASELPARRRLAFLNLVADLPETTDFN